MVYDDIVVGSGLAALGTVIGLPKNRRVLILEGKPKGTLSFYNKTHGAPCAYSGPGGLGNYWHGVIALGLQSNFGNADSKDFICLFKRFYPHTDIEPLLGRSNLFVPWKPIRPATAFKRLQKERQNQITRCPQHAIRFEVSDASITVHTTETRFSAKRLWIAAGALGTPALLDNSFEQKISRDKISDHIICYVGQVTQDALATHTLPATKHTCDGVLFPAFYADNYSAICTLKPARFAFRQLDYGIEARSIFGLPTGSVITKLARSCSPGLLSEALYNKTGLFPNAERYSVYAQLPVHDGYKLRTGKYPLEPESETIYRAIEKMHACQPFEQLLRTRRPELFIPGIHLHHSVTNDALQRININSEKSPIQIVDASIQETIGCDHHSFKIMLAAAQKASASC